MSKEDQRRRLKAFGAMGVSALMFSFMAASTKWATRPIQGSVPISGSEIALFRYAYGVVFMLFLAGITQKSLLGNDRKALFWRGISGGIASLFFFVGIQYSTLTNASLLNSASVVWSSLIAVFVLGESLSVVNGFAIVLALAGAYLVINPRVRPSSHRRSHLVGKRIRRRNRHRADQATQAVRVLSASLLLLQSHRASPRRRVYVCDAHAVRDAHSRSIWNPASGRGLQRLRSASNDLWLQRVDDSAGQLDHSFERRLRRPALASFLPRSVHLAHGSRRRFHSCKRCVSGSETEMRGSKCPNLDLHDQRIAMMTRL